MVSMSRFCLSWMLLVVCWITFTGGGSNFKAWAMAKQHRILVDTDVDTDDLFAILYLLKLNRSEFDLKAVTINANGWTNAGHAVNQLYDMLYMMGRDDIPVGVGGEGGISYNGTIFPDVGGYLPIIEQGMTTTGYCRYRQAIPVGEGGGRLDIDTNYGIRKAFLPQGQRRYVPVRQPTAQQVMIDVISKGPTNVFLIGAHTNFALFLMHNPQLKKNVEHIYIMGGGVRSSNPTGCCPASATTTCKPEQCGDRGNMFTDYTSNPYAEFNMFGDPFAAYQVIHSGIPVTLVPLDATNTIPITKEFFVEFEQNQNTYEAQYSFKSLKLARDIWFNDEFFSSYFMWDSFMAGIAVSIMSDPNNLNGENEFAEMEYMNITVRTSNKPYGVSDGSNPFFDERNIPRFHLAKDGVHSGHVQRSLRDPFCLDKNGKGKCMDGYTEEVTGSEGVKVLVATRAKPNKDPKSPLDREFYVNFLNVLNHPHQSGKFNLTTQFPHYKEVFYKPDLGAKKLGRPVILDIDMSAGDFLALFYLLKVPVEMLNLKAIFVTPTGWANAATIDIVYDILHMMGRDDIQVGLGDVFAKNQSDVLFSAVGDCKYQQAIPHGSGGLLDSDTLYGLARELPRSPRRYTAENSVKFGAPRDTEHPELRQPLALEVWENITKTMNAGTKMTILTNGPLTTLSKILSSDTDAPSKIQDVFVLGGNINDGSSSRGNVFTVPSNKHAELNMYLDPLSAKMVLESKLPITLITSKAQRNVSAFDAILGRLSRTKKTVESRFAHRLIYTLLSLKKEHHQYKHVDMFLGEILGAAILADGHSSMKPTYEVKPIRVLAAGSEEIDGQIVVDAKDGIPVKVLKYFDQMAYYDLFAKRIGDKKQSAVVGSFFEQKRMWTLDCIT